MLPTPGPGGSRLMLAPASARSLCTPTARFPQSCPAREDALGPALRGLASLSTGIRADPPSPSGCAMESRQDHILLA